MASSFRPSALRRISTLLFAVLVLGAGACVSSVGGGGDGPPDHVLAAAERLPLEVCPDIPTALCGTYAVPEDRDDPASRTIDLAVVVVPANDEPLDPDPIVFLAGGPGGSVTDAAGFVGQQIPERTRDVLLVDQRGTGRSGGLFCQLQGRDGDLGTYYEDMWPVAEVERCRREHEEAGANLAAYTTAAFADDLDEVREWLGYEELNLNGGSYGTRMAQTYVRRHPEHVRTVVLQGVVPMDAYQPIDHARWADRSFHMVFETCRQDAECHAAFPDLAGDWETVLRNLDEEPALLEIEDPETGEVYEARLERRVWAESLRSLLYVPAGATDFPYIVHRAAQGDFDPFVESTLPRKRNLSQYLADGLYLSVTCTEDIPFLTEEEIERRTAGTASGRYRIEQQQRACSLWPRGELPAGTHEPVATDLPVLLLSGSFDPVTPPSYGEQVAAHLPNGLHVVVPEGHHGYDGLSNPECVLDLITDFVDQASFEGLDTTCVDSMERPPFATSAEMLGSGGQGDEQEREEG